MKPFTFLRLFAAVMIPAFCILISFVVLIDAEQTYKKQVDYAAIFSKVASTRHEANLYGFYTSDLNTVKAANSTPTKVAGFRAKYTSLGTRQENERKYLESGKVSRYSGLSISLHDVRPDKSQPLPEYPQPTEGELICKEEQGCKFEFVDVHLPEGHGVIHRDGKIELVGNITQERLLQVVMRSFMNFAAENDRTHKRESEDTIARFNEYITLVNRERLAHLKTIALLKKQACAPKATPHPSDKDVYQSK